MSDYVAELYNAHKEVARLWRNAGKPRNGDLFELRRVSKARYKYALRFIKRNEADMRKESLGNKLADSDSWDFWKEIKGVNNAKMPLPTSIEGVTGESNIASLWRDHYNMGDATQLTFLNARMLMMIYRFYQMKLRKL